MWGDGKQNLPHVYYRTMADLSNEHTLQQSKALMGVSTDDPGWAKLATAAYMIGKKYSDASQEERSRKEVVDYRAGNNGGLLCIELVLKFLALLSEMGKILARARGMDGLALQGSVTGSEHNRRTVLLPALPALPALDARVGVLDERADLIHVSGGLHRGGG